MKIALVHDWLTGMRGGEKVLEAMCEIWPEADLFTLLHVPGKVSPTIERHRIETSFIQKLPSAPTWYRNYLPFFPTAIERFDLSAYDLIVSTSHCVAKGVKTRPDALHISYIHTPMRYVWELFDEYFGPGKISPIKRLAMKLVRPYLQRWDVKSATRVTQFIANSEHVRKRIQRHYGRDAAVINPPVDTGRFAINQNVDEFYLIVSAFAPYKRIDLAVEAFAKLGKPLKIVGAGQDDRKIRRLAPPNVEFLGWQSDKQISELYSRCRAFIFPGEEDFGITPLEAQASGRPVIAYAKGGALETVRGVYPDGEAPEAPITGVFFRRQTAQAICEAVEFFESGGKTSGPDAIKAHAMAFDRDNFKNRIEDFVAQALSEARNGDGA